MKKILFTLSLCLCLLSAAGQTLPVADTIPGTKTYHVYRDFGMGFAPSVLFNTPNGTSPAIAVKMRMFLGRYVSFDSHIVLGNDYFMFGPGMIAIPAWLIVFGPSFSGVGSFDEVIALAAMILLAAEHTAFHIPVNNFVDISPYISFLGYKENYKHDVMDFPGIAESQACFSAGIELNKYFNRLVLSPYIEYTRGYSDKISGINAGVYFGFYIFSKRR